MIWLTSASSLHTRAYNKEAAEFDGYVPVIPSFGRQSGEPPVPGHRGLTPHKCLLLFWGTQVGQFTGNPVPGNPASTLSCFTSSWTHVAYASSDIHGHKNKSLLRKERSTVLQCLLCCQRCCVVSVFAGEDDKLILCDECNKAFHLFCLRPALYEVPDGEWQCPACQPPTARRNSRGRWEFFFSFKNSGELER